MEFHQVLKFFAPSTLPEVALVKVQSFVSRCRASSLPSRDSPRLRKTLSRWASQDSSSLLMIQVRPGAQAKAKELTTDVISRLNRGTHCVFWNLSMASATGQATSIIEVLKSVIFQALRYSENAITEYAEQFSLAKIHGYQTELELVNLLYVIISKLSSCFIVIDTEGLHQAYHHDAAWAQRFLQLFRDLANRATTSGSMLKILLVMQCSSMRTLSYIPNEINPVVAFLQPPVPIPPRLRHMYRRPGIRMQSWIILLLTFLFQSVPNEITIINSQ